MLTDAELRNTRGKSKAYKKTDRDGLYVLVTPSGGIAFKYDCLLFRGCVAAARPFGLTKRTRLAFSHFISVQHFGTKRIAEVIGDGRLPSGLPVEFQNIWPVMRNVLVANMGFSLFADRQRWRLRTVRAAGIRRFITSDQPVMNLLEPVGHNDLALYYPLDPTVAALMEHLDNPGVVGEQTELDDDAVRMLNRRIFAFSHEQVIGTHPDEFADLEEADWASAALSGLLTFGAVGRQIASREPLETDRWLIGGAVITAV